MGHQCGLIPNAYRVHLMGTHGTANTSSAFECTSSDGTGEWSSCELRRQFIQELVEDASPHATLQNIIDCQRAARTKTKRRQFRFLEAKTRRAANAQHAFTFGGLLMRRLASMNKHLSPTRGHTLSIQHSKKMNGRERTSANHDATVTGRLSSTIHSGIQVVGNATS